MNEGFEKVIILYTYRYIMKDRKGNLTVRYLTEPQENHKKFQQSVLDCDDVVSCVREYINEVNFSYLGFTEPVKTEKKEDLNNEKV